jgi:hypothetical protein
MFIFVIHIYGSQQVPLSLTCKGVEIILEKKNTFVDSNGCVCVCVCVCVHFISIYVLYMYVYVWGHAVALLVEAALQARRLRVRFPMVSLEFFIVTILPAVLWSWG